MSDLRIDISELGLQEVRTPKGMGGGDGPAHPRWGRRLRWALGLALPAAVVPFVLLLRGSLHAHGVWGFGPWASVLTGMVFAAGALAAAVWILARLLRLPGGLRRVVARGGVILGVVFLAHGLLYIGVRNAKGEAVRAEYRSLHPLLRVASTVLVLVDGDAVVTDTRRTPEDYAAMGLTPADASLHYPQPDGYVHALDLRTVGRGEWRNRLVDWGFRLMGFRVLRHVGTADHLHISLPAGGGG